MEIRHLELLRELSVRGSLTAVAAATHRTPSALSQQLRTAERDFGVQLTEPVARGLRLTAEGQLLADGSDAVLRAVADLESRLAASRGRPGGLVTIGTLPSAGAALLPELVRRLRGTEITLDIDDFDLMEADYAARTLDVDIVIAHSLTGDIPLGAEGLTSTVVAREPIDVAIRADHRLATRATLTPQDLVGTTWIGVPEGYPFDSVLIAVENAPQHSLHRVIRLRDNNLVESLVAAGEGLALLPRFTTRPSDAVKLIELRGVPAVRSIVAMSRPDRAARSSVAFVVNQLTHIGAELTPQSGR